MSAFPQHPHLIFVYGTLKRGDCRHHVLKDQHYLGEATTLERYRLYHLGSYPGLVESPTGGVAIQGELYAVTPDCLRELDFVEGVAEGLYSRHSIELQQTELELFTDRTTSRSLIEAYFYLGNVENFLDLGSRWEVVP